MLRRHLYGAFDYPVTLTDPFRDTFIGKLQNVQSLGLKRLTAAGEGADNVVALYQVTIDEITETTEGSAEAVWDASDWNDGRVWGD